MSRLFRALIVGVFTLSFFMSIDGVRAAEFEKFTLYNELGIGLGLDDIASSDEGAYVGNLDYRFGIRERYLSLVLQLRGSFLSDKVASTTQTYTKTGLGFGIEWDIPMRIYFGAIMGFFTEEVGFPQFESGTILEVAYYFSPNTLVSISTESLKFDTIEMSMMSLMFHFPIDIDYPSTSWRRNEIEVSEPE